MLYKLVAYDEQGKCFAEVYGEGELVEPDRIEVKAEFPVPGWFKSIHVGRVDFYTPNGSKRVGTVVHHFRVPSGSVIKYTGSLQFDAV